MCRRIPKLRLVSAFLVAVFLVFLAVPLGNMLFSINGESTAKVFANNNLWRIILNSLLASGLTTVITVTLAYLLALCMERTAMRGKGILRTLIIIPMLIPSVSIGMGTVLLGGNNGILTRIFGWGNSLYGLVGIVCGSVLYSLPVAFLMLSDILKYEDSSPYEAAEILGISPVRRFSAISLPYLKKPLITVCFSVFTLSFTDYGVPLMVGGSFKTLPMLMYQEVIGQLDFGKGCIYGLMLLVPAVVAFIIDVSNKSAGNSAFVIKPFEIKPCLKKDSVAFVFSALMAVVSLLPILSFVVLAFFKKYPYDNTLTLQHFEKTMAMNGGNYFINSIIIALLVSAAGVLIGVVTAYFTARIGGKAGRALHLIAMATGAVPGVVLGLAYIMFFKGSFLYGTLIILVIVNTVHFFSSPYLMMYNSFSKMNPNLEAVASTLGISKLRLLKDILIRGSYKTLMEMFSYFFVNSMMTISAVSFLANTINKPIALMINQFEAQAQLEAAAVVSLMILCANLIMRAVTQRNKTN